MIGRRLSQARTLLRLGAPNIARVAWYRLLGRIGHYRRVMPGGGRPRGPFFSFVAMGEVNTASKSESVPTAGRDIIVARAQAILDGRLIAYGNETRETGFPPDWHWNPATGKGAADQRETHWSDIDEFRLQAGDIKDIWEASRFDGLVTLTQAWLLTRDSRFSEAVEKWLSDWCENNPVNQGVNWKCAQETGIRLMHVIVVADLLRRYANVMPAAGYWDFVNTHAARIAPTMLYAVAQENNHATSEAAALYMAALEVRQGTGVAPAIRQAADHWYRLGRHWLAGRAQRLILPDGSFSQHSVNYHRLMLDTLTLAQWWSIRSNDRDLGAMWHSRLRAATRWLHAMTDPISGGAPNLGANDGARLVDLDGNAYRDFRPSVQMATIVFAGKCAYAGIDANACNGTMYWLGMPIPSALESVPSRVVFPEGGYAWLSFGEPADGGRVMLRYPTYRFRPSHADGLHVDVWWRGRNVLRDGGTYAYNTDAATLNYFSGTASHNTIQFGQRNQMPRLSRFLYGDWLRCETQSTDLAGGQLSASYRNRQGDRHQRDVRCGQSTEIVVTDVYESGESEVTLRWRLAPGAWRLEGDVCTDGVTSIRVEGSSQLALACGQESLHYAERTELPVLEARGPGSGRFVTTLLMN
ncbi:heparinase II/III-family protein [Pandoraea sp. XY-2]|uniref:heparinase II/III family protein n=1 Tax=Pandoraea sp. XY-2 TaxID=2518599 RepID=UPI00101B1883|nr:heparinase II/III-family protein [Pandoraea sp. XY-2]QBC33463.1 heparinase [Pandoraea sp. XY-2]